jgi:hypothetical protein
MIGCAELACGSVGCAELACGSVGCAGLALIADVS